MSDTKDQYNCESIAIAQLALQSDLSTINTAGGIVHFDKDTQTSGGSIDRIVVEAGPRMPYAYGTDMSTVLLFSCDVKVTVFLAQNSSATLNTYIAAIQAAFTGSTPASIVTLKNSLFGSTRGYRYFYTEDGERQDTKNERQASQTWKAIFDAP